MEIIRYLFIAGFIFIMGIKSFAATPPDLGDVASYAIFSGYGPVRDTGQSRITGNIGTNNGDISGFENIYGEIHHSNEYTIDAANDLIIAYNFLNSANPTHSLGSIIGNRETLKAGVYRSKGMVTLKDILYLDGGGDANAVFIIQINGSLSSLSQAKVKLINNAQAGNVFWKVEGNVKLGPGTFIVGNIIANNGDIIFSLNDTLEGRALTTKGLVSVNKLETFGNIINVPTVPLDGELWILLGIGVLLVGARFKKLNKLQLSIK